MEQEILLGLMSEINKKENETFDSLWTKSKFESKSVQDNNTKKNAQMFCVSSNKARYEYQNKNIRNHKSYLNNKRKYQYNRW